MALYKFFWDCGRQGELHGVFAASDDDIQNAIGRDVYFGEVLGKHSEVHGTLDVGDLEKLDADQEFIDKASAIGLIPNGFNPLDYIEIDEETPNA